MTNLPDKDIFEVALIGTGGGYGESIVMHIGNQNWVVVDSCINPKTGESLPLEYLREKGVNIATDVKQIICTHWHDDHIQGISDLLNECKSSMFSMARTTDRQKFLMFVELDYLKAKNEGSASSTVEILKCFNILKERNGGIKGAEQDKLLFRTEFDENVSEIFSLSPSESVIDDFNYEISSLIKDYSSSNRKVIINKPNDKCVVLLVKVNDHRVLLGSDLEVSDDINKGWICILDKCQCIDLNKCSLFKIPHHGSKNGYHKRIWDELISPKAIAKLTPWNLGEKLPQDEMLEVYLDKTESLYITSFNKRSRSAKKRERSIFKAIQRFNNSVQEVKYEKGIIRCRIGIRDEKNEWDIDLLGEAKRITRTS